MLVNPSLLLLLGLIYVVLQPSHPERKPFPWQRMIRIVAKVAIDFVVMVLVIFQLYVGSFEWLGAITAAENSVPPIGWARDTVAAGFGGAIAIGVLLVVLAIAAVAMQYLVDHTFSRQSLGRRLDGISRTTGTPERAVYAIGTVITAGFGEEVIFRALLPATVYALTSNIAIALLLPLLLFALLHYDQGYRGILNAAVVGAAATVVFLVTQQLWWAIALHAIANLLATVIVPEVQRARVRRIVRRAIRGQLAASRPETT